MTKKLPEVVTVSLDARTHELLTGIAVVRRIPRSEVIREMIEAGLKEASSSKRARARRASIGRVSLPREDAVRSREG